MGRGAPYAAWQALHLSWRDWSDPVRRRFFALLGCFTQLGGISDLGPPPPLRRFVLFFVTMRRQIRHMIKHRYIPISFGKKVGAVGLRGRRWGLSAVHTGGGADTVWWVWRQGPVCRLIVCMMLQAGLSSNFLLPLPFASSLRRVLCPRALCRCMGRAGASHQRAPSEGTPACAAWPRALLLQRGGQMEQVGLATAPQRATCGSLPSFPSLIAPALTRSFPFDLQFFLLLSAAFQTLMLLSMQCTRPSMLIGSPRRQGPQPQRSVCTPAVTAWR